LVGWWFSLTIVIGGSMKDFWFKDAMFGTSSHRVCVKSWRNRRWIGVECDGAGTNGTETDGAETDRAGDGLEDVGKVE
jgi:hypothetical protein